MAVIHTINQMYIVQEDADKIMELLGKMKDVQYIALTQITKRGVERELDRTQPIYINIDMIVSVHQ